MNYILGNCAQHFLKQIIKLEIVSHLKFNVIGKKKLLNFLIYLNRSKI